MKAVVYDCEIVKAIPSSKEPVVPGVMYCGGWTDFAGMGVSVICAYEYEYDRCRVFLRDNFPEFAELACASDVVIGFNNGGFDDKLVEANLDLVIPPQKSYDLLSEIWVASGLGRRFAGPQYGGFGLDACAKANGLPAKSGDGALAPVLWQQGKTGQVIDYCLRDVWLTKKLVDLVLWGAFKSPKEVAFPFSVKRPF